MNSLQRIICTFGLDFTSGEILGKDQKHIEKLARNGIKFIGGWKKF